MERTGTHSKILTEVSGQVKTLQTDYHNLANTVSNLEKNDKEQAKEIKKTNAFFEAVKNNWKGALAVILIIAWIYEHGFIHV